MCSIDNQSKEAADLRKRAQEIPGLNERLLDALPHPAMLIDKNRNIIAANKVARGLGAIIGGLCWRDFGHSLHISEEDRLYYEQHGSQPPDGIKCTFCLADDALDMNKEFNDPEVYAGDKFRDTYWVPLGNDIYLHYSIDVTAIKQAGEALTESEEKFRALFESSKDGIVFFDMEDSLKNPNKAFLNIIGYPENEIIKMKFQDLTPEKWHRMEADIIENQVIKRGYSNEYEKEYIRKDGTVIPVSVRKWLFRDDKGNPVGMWGIVRDITERKKAELELENYREHLEELVVERTKELMKKQESLSQAQRIGRMGNWEWDIMANKMEFSAELLRICGLIENKFDSTYEEFLALVHPDDRTSLKRTISDALLNENSYSVDYRIVWSNGTQRIVNEQGEVYRDREGNAVRMVGTVQDVTERKTGEDTLKERERQLTYLSRKVISSQEEERVRIARDLHDTLGQRMMAMSLEINFLEKQLGPEKECIQELKKMMSIVSEDLQRIYEGLRPMALEKLGLEAALEALVWEYKDNYDYEVALSINQFNCKIEPTKEIIIYRILQEALTNIVRHSEASHIKVLLQRDGSVLVMDIFDDGKGFAGAKDMENWGYGLIGMKERVSICGGELGIASEPCGGTLVSVRIPIMGKQEELNL